jgi:outer membrane protein OmpA-like peptidoglycan-associated protein
VRISCLAAALLLGGLLSSPAQAQAPRFALSSFEPSLPGDRFFSVPDASVRLDTLPLGKRRGGPLGAWIAGASASLETTSGLLIARSAATGQERPAIRRRTLAHLDLLAARWRRIALDASIPLLLSQRDDPEALSLLGVNKSTGILGDLRLAARGVLLGTPQTPFSLALQGAVRLPTGKPEALQGDPQARPELRLVASGKSTHLTYAASAGYGHRARLSTGEGELGPALLFGAAAGYTLPIRAGYQRLNALQLSWEIFGNTLLPRAPGGSLLASRGTPLETLLGLRLFEETPGHTYMALGLAMGSSLTHATGTPGFRALATVSFSAGEDEFPEDRDGDGIEDRMDACPERPGPASEEPTAHGCPPRPDLDGDGIPDDQDACVDQPGSRSSIRARHGCPPPRPPEPPPPEPPPPEPPPPEPPREVLQIDEQILFEYRKATLAPGSERPLARVVELLAMHPEILEVTIEGHTDPSGEAGFNERLSLQRAEAVREWLVRRGVEGGRLKVAGFGSQRPVASNDTEEGRRKNRRVIFVVTRRASGGP